jgi:cyclopropane-fatty-acyl-phospholipid synthase
MNSRIYQGQIFHTRLEPIRHTFRYPVYTYAFDLDELPLLDRTIPWFGHNRLRPIALHDRDYLVAADGETLRDRVFAVLRRGGVGEQVHRIVLVTGARFFNYVFNPVSFFACYDKEGAVVCHIAEVNNTFRERSIYLLDRPTHPRHGYKHRYIVSKDFYVSPFNDPSGEFDFQFADIGDRLDIRVDARREGRMTYHAIIEGDGQPISGKAIVRTLSRFPVTAALTTPRILWQAARLHYQRGLPVVPQPIPNRDTIIRTDKPGIIDGTAMRLVCGALRQIQRGQLSLRLPDGQWLRFGDPTTGLRGEMHIRSWRFFRRVVAASDIGFGESFQEGEWDSPDLTAALSVMADNMDVVAWQSTLGRFTAPILAGLRRLMRLNSRTGSRRNIQAHYDLGNEMYKLFLDPTMMYSSAVFASEDEDLESAQKRKLTSIIQKARIDSSHHVLEIGSGWGGFAIEAVRQTGCRVTTITLSREQKKLAEERIRAAGLSERIKVQLCDYREIRGRFDRIVSIEMLEAVGHEFHSAYFAALNRLLHPGGLAVLQVITMPDFRYPTYIRTGDWIQKYIFPGCAVPSLAALAKAMADASQLQVESLENIGPHYAPTLAHWRERFLDRKADILALGYDERFLRTWHYYFAYCEAGFARRAINNLHLVLTRPGNQTLDTPVRESAQSFSSSPQEVAYT